MSRYDEPKVQFAEDLSLEQAEDIKRDLYGDTSTQQRKGVRAKSYVQQLEGAPRIVEIIKEFFGFGIADRYKAHLQRLGEQHEQLTTMSTNCSQVVSTYAQHMKVSAQAFHDDRRRLAINQTIYTKAQTALQQRKDQYASLESQSVLGAMLTTEALSVQKDISDLEGKLLEIDHENDALAIKLMVYMHTDDTRKGMYARLQEVQRNVERQRALFGAHYEIAKANHELVKGIDGVRFASEVYEKSHDYIEQLKDLQEKLKVTTFDAFSSQAQLESPKLPQPAESGIPYWQTVARELKKRNW